MKTLLYIIVFILTFAAIGCTQPQPVNVTFTFTATGQSGSVGTATDYDIRFHTDTLVLIAWDSAWQVQDEPIPMVAGSSESFILPVELPTPGVTYYFAIKASNRYGIYSGHSNIKTIEGPDWSAPAAILNFDVSW